MAPENKNKDVSTVAGFGDEWSRFQQEKLDTEERQKIFDDLIEHFFDF